MLLGLVDGLHFEEHFAGTDDGWNVSRVELHGGFHVQNRFAPRVCLPECLGQMSSGFGVGGAGGDRFVQDGTSFVPFTQLHCRHAVLRKLATGCQRLGDNLFLAHRATAASAGENAQTTGKQYESKGLLSLGISEKLRADLVSLNGKKCCGIVASEGPATQPMCVSDSIC